uniref:ATP synthase F(0) complex subunit e, mitochondrial n=1 Tax=Leptobrachium leishanense TaxID=445787 RepID=A0A8C5M009_9ANUR
EVPPIEVPGYPSFTRYSALLVGFIYGKTRYDHLKPIAEEERRIETEEKAKRDEAERIAKELAAGRHSSCLTLLTVSSQLFISTSPHTLTTL